MTLMTRCRLRQLLCRGAAPKNLPPTAALIVCFLHC
jgi:hypothetical protein